MPQPRLGHASSCPSVPSHPTCRRGRSGEHQSDGALTRTVRALVAAAPYPLPPCLVQPDALGRCAKSGRLDAQPILAQLQLPAHNFCVRWVEPTEAHRTPAVRQVQGHTSSSHSRSPRGCQLDVPPAPVYQLTILHHGTLPASRGWRFCWSHPPAAPLLHNAAGERASVVSKPKCRSSSSCVEAAGV